MKRPRLCHSASRSIFIRTGGYRFVLPYADEWAKNVKARWVGRRLDDVLAAELPFIEAPSLAKAFDIGRIRVDDAPADRAHVLALNQRVTMQFHRHEPEVCDHDVAVLHEDDTLLAVNKPPSVPVHPSGRYKRNTVIGILEADRPDLFEPASGAGKGARIIHRLDRLVSGVLLMGRGAAAAAELSAMIRAGHMRKEYVARVAGRFPEGETVVTEPIGCASRGIYQCGGEGAKEAHTIFRREAVLEVGGGGVESQQGNEAVESLVRCIPITGRTHQLRLHLAHLGHPITDDIKYGGRCEALEAALEEQQCEQNGCGAGEEEEKEEEGQQQQQQQQQQQKQQQLQPEEKSKASAAAPAAGPARSKGHLDTAKLVVPDPVWPDSSRDAHCRECEQGFRDIGSVTPEDLLVSQIRLHALRYSCYAGQLVGGDCSAAGELLWSVEAPRPEWAKLPEGGKRG